MALSRIKGFLMIVVILEPLIIQVVDLPLKELVSLLVELHRETLPERLD